MPEAYKIRLAPDIAKRTFSGSETVKLNVRAPVRQLVFNALEIEIANASLDGKALPKTAIHVDAKQETVTVDVGSEISAGVHALALEFSGKINEQGQGLFFVPYQEQGERCEEDHAGHPIRSYRCAPILSVLGRAELSRALSADGRRSGKLDRCFQHAGRK